MIYLYYGTTDTLVKRLFWWYTRGKDVHEIGEFWRQRVIYIVLYSKAVCNYIIYDVPIKLHKTYRWFRTPSSIYTFENRSSKQRGGEKDQHKYLIFRSEFMHDCYLHIYHPIPSFISQPGMYWIHGGKWVWGSEAQDPAISVHTIAATSQKFGRQDHQNMQKLKNPFIRATHDRGLCIYI